MALSGLAPTVETAFELVAKDADALADGRAALERLGLDRVLPQNPFTLSGGEQVAVAIIAAALARPQRLAIDSALEQLAPETRTTLLSWLHESDGAAMIADNRLKEWYDGPVEELDAPADAPHISDTLPAALKAEPVSVELVDLSFGYTKERLVFDRLNLTLEAGRPYHLCGPNGAGKTTLSKLLCGLLKPKSGEIRANGRKVDPWRTPGRFVSYHFQNPTYQLFARTVADQLRTAPDPASAARHIGLTTAITSHPLDLPFVLRKRLALGSALFRGRHFLIADEPTLGQDYREASAMGQLLGHFGGLRISHSRLFDDLPAVTL
jgi:energy-coupling factor transporter ATP-binding protein EcfA2